MISDIPWPDASRRAAFEGWIADIAPAYGLDITTLCAASADASFRRYLRIDGRGRTLIVMDAPPPLEDVRPFVHVAGLVAAAGLTAPRVLEADTAWGFLLLSDLGCSGCLEALQRAAPVEADRLMRRAIDALLQWQQGVPAVALPAFSETLLRSELQLFPDWCVEREFGVVWSAAETAVWQQICDTLVQSAMAQPVVAVHADFMPRNLMLCEPPAGVSGQVSDAALTGILDFQDAMAGPLTYDLASLLRDAFISWQEPQELDWAVRWWQQARAAGLPVHGAYSDFGEFWRALEWMGLQRHLKVMGIFCRLKHRDGKSRYAADLPRFFGYASKVAMRYRPLAPLLKLMAPLSGQRVTSGWTF